MSLTARRAIRQDRRLLQPSPPARRSNSWSRGFDNDSSIWSNGAEVCRLRAFLSYRKL